MNIDLVLYIIAIVMFCLAGFQVHPPIRWEWLAFAVMVLSLVV